MLEVYHFVTPLRFRVQDSCKLAQEGGKIHTLWLKFCLLQEEMYREQYGEYRDYTIRV